MITVEDALDRVVALAGPPQAEAVPIAQALGRVMLRPAISRMTQPPFDAAAMDGYALRAADLGQGLDVIGEAAAGRPWDGQARAGTAVRIFTGAPVPPGYDCVVMQENVVRDGDRISISAEASKPNIRPQGNDFHQGMAFHPDRPLRPGDLALLAAMNIPVIEVARRPRVAILSSGDELVPPGTDPAPGQIIASNDVAVAGLAMQAGAEALCLPIALDSEDSIRDRLRMAEGSDLIVTIGGASVGDHDLFGNSDRLGIERAFYKVAMRPGKPLIAGRIGAAAMLGLPGNPVSAIVCSKLFMQPLIRAMQGLAPAITPEFARLTEALPAEGPRQHYQRARLAPVLGDLPGIAPYRDQDSARLALMAEADALLIRPAGDPPRSIGEVMPYLRLD